MSVWQVYIYQTTIWNCASMLYGLVKVDEIFKDLPNVFGNADDNLIAEYDTDSRQSLKMTNVDMPERKSKAK